MKKTITISILALAIATIYFGFKFMVSRGDSNEESKRTLYVYTWADYIEPGIVEEFEKTRNCHVVIDTFEDNETMLAKMLIGNMGYDLIFPSSYVVPVMVRNNMLSVLDMSALTNVTSNFDKKYERFLHKDSMKHSVPYAFSITGIAYRKDKVKDGTIALKCSWDDLKNPIFSKRVCMMRDMREVLGMGLVMTGHSVNDTSDEALSNACEYAYGMKCAVTCMDNEAYKPGLASGEFFAAQGYNSDILQIMDENKSLPVDFMVPKEGTTCCFDEMVVPNESKNKDLAYDFMNYLYDAKVAAKNLKFIASAIPNKAMMEFVDKEVFENQWVNPTEEMLALGQLIEDVGNDIEKFQKWWDVFLSRKAK